MSDHFSEPPREVYEISVEPVIRLIVRRGTGKTDDDPTHLVTQYWTRDGDFIGERDRWAQERQAGKEAKAKKGRAP
jgi:hypothetical protein